MRLPFISLLKRFQVKKTLQFHGSYGSLQKVLDAMCKKQLKSEDFTIQKNADESYSLIHLIIVGNTYIRVGGMEISNDEVEVTFTTKSISENHQQILLKGATHKFHYLIFAGFAIFITLVVSQFLWIPALVLGLFWVILHLWFNFIYTSSEKSLIDEFKTALHVRVNAGFGL